MINLTHTCIITKDVSRITEFYKKVLKAEPAFENPRYVEFETEVAKLAIFDIKAHETVAPGSLAPESNNSIIIEFNVEDVDAEYARLKAEGIEIVREPSNQVWGVRSFYFRDCDGNLLDFYKQLTD